MQTISSQSKSSGATFIAILVLFLSACGGGGGTQGAGQVSGNQQLPAAGTQESTTRESDTSANSIQSSDTTVSTGSFALEWTAPVSRTDGSPLSLSEISGFHVYYGTSAGRYTKKADIADGSAQGITLTNLPVGTYYVVMTTYDDSGLESGYSAMVTKTVLDVALS